MNLLTIISTTLALFIPSIASHSLDFSSSHNSLSNVASDSTPHPFCTPPQDFTVGYQHCTFASAILSSSLSSSNTGTLADAWIFDSLCQVLGTASNIQTNTLAGGIFNMGSTLKDDAKVDFGDGRLGIGSPVVEFGGKSAQADVGQECWWLEDDNKGEIWGCAFEFECW